jgi:pyruvate dehydrogenase phosphatase
MKPSKQIMVNISDKENESPHQDAKDPKETAKEEQVATGGAAPLGKLASRMKSMLKRRNTEKRRLRKERGYYEVDHVEDAHWTEM